MARKRDSGELARSLRAPAFGNADAGPGPATLDPVSPTTLVLRVSDITAYDHNPRVAANLSFPQLKESIRARRGLTTPLTVTKRPGDDRFTIAAGGNSRLKALKELADETGDDTFATITCRFEPWDSECQVFANHLIENDVRGNMIFGDKARAILEWQRLYEDAHLEEPPLTQRQLVDRLAEAGYRVPRSLITPLLNTAKLLLPHLPVLFNSGLGRPAAEALIRLRGCCERYWNDQGPVATDETFDAFFAAVCVEADGHAADFDQTLFASTLTIRLAKALGLDHNVVALDIDSLYHGFDIDADRSPRGVAEADTPPPKPPWVFERAREIQAVRLQRSRARIGARADAAAPAGAVDEVEGETDAPASDSPKSAPSRLDPARAREMNYLAALELAARHEIDAYLKPIDTGLGFFIEAPEPAEVPAADKDRPTGPADGLALRGLRSSAWWHLCFLADQLSPTGIAAIAPLQPASWLVELFTELPKREPGKDPSAMLHILVGEPSPVGIVAELLTEPTVTDEAFSALDRLLRGCHALRVEAAAGRIRLWETSR
jgi:ParB family protein of integrating conjugative element (PFGI_1 class)